MNQNYNNTEYEIMDNGAREYQPRYPLAQAPGSELQNMNNQDVMNTCIERTYDIAQQQNTQQAVLVATGITFKILGLASPALSAAGGVIQSIIKLLWPKPNNQEVWDSFMNAVEALIDQKIEQYARNKAIAELEGLENILEEYEDVLKIYNAEPTVAHRERLRNLVISIDLFFENSMPSFRVAGQEVPLLTVFANAANLHLAFLRDIVQFGSEWGFSQLEIDDFYKNGLEELTQKYTDHCVNTYNKGLEQSKTLTADLCNFNQYPWTRYNQGFREEEKPNCSSQQISQRFDEQVNPSMASVRWSQTEYRGLENWNLYNAFRRDMTIMVLDIVSLWPTYNPRLYNNLNGVRSELTRELYTDIRGTTYRSDASQNSLSAIEERMIPKPSLFKWLTQLHFYSRQLGNADNWTAGQIVTALQTMIRKTLGNEEVLPFVGTIGTAVKTLYPGDFGGITWIDTLQWFEPRWLKFWSGNDNTGWTYQGELGTIVEKNPFWAAGPLTRIYYPSERANYIPEHRLSWVTYEPIRSNSPYGWTEYTQLGALALGWTHESVDPKNTMEVDKITRIPAVKAYDIGASGPGQVIKGPGSTGGDLVSLSYNTSMKVRLTTPYTTQKKTYRVRIRYASTGNTQMYVKRESTTTSPIAQTFNVPQTYSGGALTYQTFKYFDTITISTSSGITPNDLAFEITIQNQSNTTLIIDQIEFIPLSSGSGATPAGTYQLVSALNNSSVVTLNLTNNNVELWQNNDDSNQKWRFEYNKSLDSFILRNVANQNLILSWVWTGANFYYNVNVVPSNPDDVYSWPKNWIPIDAGGGYNRLRAYGGGWDGAITVENGETKNGTNIHYDTYSGKTSQKFRLVKLS